MAAETIMPPVHPGEILQEEFLSPFSLSQYQLAKELSVPARRINEIVHGQRRITADTALRLARYFGTSERFWRSRKTSLAPRSTRSARCAPRADIRLAGRMSPQCDR
jgi:antitoxin HigA-1